MTYIIFLNDICCIEIQTINDMKTLNKTSYNYILKLIADNDLRYLLAYTEGLGVDHSKYSSPIHYLDGKLTITYRRNKEYYYI